MHETEVWNLYAHCVSTAETYGASYEQVARIDSLETWAGVWNHVHPELIGSQTFELLVNRKKITSWSLFREHISPEWEHPKNQHGCTLTHRVAADVNAADAWTTLVMECVRGAEPDGVNGIQVTQKRYRSGILVKLDVWLDSKDIAPSVEWLRTLTGFNFQLNPR